MVPAIRATDFMTTQAAERVSKAIVEVINIPDIVVELLTAVGENCQPEDVFTDDQLNDWATENGYVRKDEE